MTFIRPHNLEHSNERKPNIPIEDASEDTPNLLFPSIEMIMNQTKDKQEQIARKTRNSYNMKAQRQSL